MKEASMFIYLFTSSDTLKDDHVSNNDYLFRGDIMRIAIAQALLCSL